MERNTFWGSPTIYARSFIVQYISLWNIFFNEWNWICYLNADDNTPYIASDNVDDVIKIFENDFNDFQITKWK